MAWCLDATPQRDLRALFDQLNLEVVYQPAEHALDVALTLYDDPSDERTDQPPRADLRRTSPVPPAVPPAAVPPAQTSPVKPSPKALGKTLKAMANGRKDLLEIARWATSSQQEVIEERFGHDMVRGP